MSKNKILFELSETVFELTHEDLLLWDYDARNDYVAAYNGMQFRLRCCAQEAVFFIDNRRFNIGRSAVMALCREIACQTTRIRQYDEYDRLRKIVELLKETT